MNKNFFKVETLLAGVIFLLFIFSACKKSNLSDWNISVLDVAKNVNYLSRVEKDVILEMNKVRTDPQKYAQMYLQPELQYYDGKMYKKPGQITMVTNEGKAAIEECIAALMKMDKGSVLSPEPGMCQAAKDHAADQGKTGEVGHTGSDGSSFTSRMQKYGGGYLYAAENISYGNGEAHDIVMSLLIDDGVSSRGHRTNIMNSRYVKTGVAVGSHPRYGSMCVIDLADVFITK